MDMALEEGHIPNIHLSAYERMVEGKYLSFQRGLEGRLGLELDLEIQNKRSEAFKQAKKNIQRRKYPTKMADTNGSVHALSSLFANLTIDRETMCLDWDLHVKLPRARWNITPRTDYENSEYASGLKDGPVSYFGSELDYAVEFQSEGFYWRHLDELDELKHIYASWHSLIGFCSKKWLQALYTYESYEEGKVESFNLSAFIQNDGLRYPPDTVFLEVDHHEIWTTVDKLYERICRFRIPGKSYPIGGCEDDLMVLYSLLLTEHYQRDEEEVISGILNGALTEGLAIAAHALTSLYDMNDQESDHDGESSLPTVWREALIAAGKFVEKDEEVQQLAENPDTNPIDFDFAAAFAAAIAAEGSEHSSDSSSDAPAPDEWEVEGPDEAPFNPWQRGHTNELLLTDVPLIEGIPETVSAPYEPISDDEEEQVLNPVDRAGVDLIDPQFRKQDNLYQQRRFLQTWAPVSRTGKRILLGAAKSRAKHHLRSGLDRRGNGDPGGT
jgi:hypothetical protein